ncbi:DNA (cytosine-5-)-methyltransferase [Hyphomonas jannaschiana]|jgi:DNA (cytosine-5)-methyltransferase 1|uniref:Cytosine-specific methyltransferase n=1 Tax=Hyphomonas jannaschiana VP2 TaxID=1280952 RepID=A0A059FL23_9PROT|nr:DNA (cytosine-5-)-methyltransferase [Hyphomonas jannaschiana]KCZ91312.1 DNA-cytosine methyltransferase [Hyphomonas jannaschiana VP2]
MTNEFAKLRQECGLSHKEAASLLGLAERTVRRYDEGETEPKKAVLIILEQYAASRRPDRVEPAFKFIDLFAGIGGLRIGFEAIGGKCVFTSEWDKYARETYVRNFPEDEDHLFAGDIREFTKDDTALDRIPEHDVLLAGFPCQPFSIAGVSKKNALGRQHGFLDETQGTLFFDVAQIIKRHRPKAFLLENVKNLERHDKGRTFATIMKVLREELGYHVTTRVISSEPWVPQKRERIFIVGFRQEADFSFDDLRVPEKPWPTLGSILMPEEQVSEKYTLTPKLWQYLQDYKAKHNAKGNGFGYGLFGPDDVTRTLSARYYKDGSEILVDRGKGRRPRRLTPTECARLMGFERGNRIWSTTVSDTQAYKQCGNAVVVPVVEAIAEVMEPHIRAAVAKDLSGKEKRQRDLYRGRRMAVNG